jgi:hypothetical protein
MDETKRCWSPTSGWRHEELAAVYLGRCERCGRDGEVGTAGKIVGKKDQFYGPRDPKDPWLCWECYKSARERWRGMLGWWPTVRLSSYLHHIAFSVEPDHEAEWHPERFGLYRRVSAQARRRLSLAFLNAYEWTRENTVPPMRWFA